MIFQPISPLYTELTLEDLNTLEKLNKQLELNFYRLKSLCVRYERIIKKEDSVEIKKSLFKNLRLCETLLKDYNFTQNKFNKNNFFDSIKLFLYSCNVQIRNTEKALSEYRYIQFMFLKSQLLIQIKE